MKFFDICCEIIITGFLFLLLFIISASMPFLGMNYFYPAHLSLFYLCFALFFAFPIFVFERIPLWDIYLMAQGMYSKFGFELLSNQNNVVQKILWCQENCRRKHYVSKTNKPFEIIFMSKYDALRFKLIWE